MSSDVWGRLDILSSPSLYLLPQYEVGLFSFSENRKLGRWKEGVSGRERETEKWREKDTKRDGR